MTEIEIGPKLIENTGSGCLERSTGCLVKGSRILFFSSLALGGFGAGVISALMVRNIIVNNLPNNHWARKYLL